MADGKTVRPTCPIPGIGHGGAESLKSLQLLEGFVKRTLEAGFVRGHLA